MSEKAKKDEKIGGGESHHVVETLHKRRGEMTNGGEGRIFPENVEISNVFEANGGGDGGEGGNWIPQRLQFHLVENVRTFWRAWILLLT